MNKNIFYIIVIVLTITNTAIAQKAEISYSTYFGADHGYNYGHGITVDDKGCAYIAGQTHSAQLPTTLNAFDRTHNGSADIFVAKFNKYGSDLIYSTFIGGSGRDDTRNIFLDKNGAVYLAGGSTSNNFPLSENSLEGNSNNYFLKLSSDGSKLEYSSKWEGEIIKVDKEGNIILAGTTEDPNFPVTSNAFSQTHLGESDVYVAKIDINTNEIIFSTFLGGNNGEFVAGIGFDIDNNIILVGGTGSSDFPKVGESLLENIENGSMYISKLKSDGSELIYSKIINGGPWGMETDNDYNIYIYGNTDSEAFYTTEDAFDKTYDAAGDAFLMKINSEATEIIYSTYIGGSGQESIRQIIVDNTKRVYITGCTKSDDFPVTENAIDNTYNGTNLTEWAWGDAFLCIMNPEGSKLEFSTYYGGSGDEEAYGVAVDSKGDAYIVGTTLSYDLPVTENAFDKTLGNYRNGMGIYVAKISFNSYFGQVKPSSSPNEFITDENNLFAQSYSCPTFSADGNEAFWSVWPESMELSDPFKIVFRKKVDRNWTEPAVAPFSGIYHDEFPSFSHDGNRIIFVSKRPVTEGGDQSKSRLWYVERTDTGWGSPIVLDDSINKTGDECFTSVAANNNLYFCRYAEKKIYRAVWNGEKYLEPEAMPLPQEGLEVVGSIAPDESYMIFQSLYTNDSDFYVTFNVDNIWSAPVSLGEEINLVSNNSPRVSTDGKYIFFLGDSKTYWVSSSIISEILTSVKTVESQGSMPSDYNLQQNYPNPFNPTTNIKYTIPSVVGTSRDLSLRMVNLTVYDLLGQEVATLVNKEQSPGNYIVEFDGSSVSRRITSGIYLYRLQCNDFVETKKMLLLR